ncbi:MAG: T9SS type A sorting domain-containing protein [Gemmatimonadetes bacterium]|nr:T9SS type A sorting domain-containing protein [Gemmatimonadota bacterium]MBT5801140.1 T9SS type A sorting domain-containing protein [Gemmatimonadota bacterium]MBT6618484.1 T9SS type A sorting domain-containing protein [Gemmatimonadota bacterium]
MMTVVAVEAQPPYLADPAPGQVFLTPRIDLDLGPVPLVVPERYATANLAERELMLPPGFSVNVFAAGEPLEGPRFMAWDPEGVLHVANMKAGGGSEFAPPVNTARPPAVEQMKGQVLALPDRDGDGVADEILVVADQFWFPNSIQFFAGYLYVADMHQVVRLRDSDGDGRYEEREIVVPDLPIGHHRTRTIEFDRQREKLYLSIGSSCDLCRESDPRRATIMEFDPDGSSGRVYASGLRNAVGLGMHPVSNELWITTNGHDREGAHLPPEMVTVVRDGGFYGWPLAFGFRSWIDFSISAYQDLIFPLTAQDSSDVERVPRPVAMLQAHTAPMDVHFYQGERFPEQYSNAALVAFRGASKSRDVGGYKVVALFADSDGQNARVGDFLTGFQSGRDVWGEPTGLATDAQGNLFVSSDWRNYMILRVVASPYVTAVADEGGVQPDGFLLAQNYPNPFNAETVIHYNIGRKGAVALSVFNLVGQQVRRLVREVRTPGFYQIVWDGRDDRGQEMASGVYIYRLQVGDLAEARKLLLLR